MLPLKIKECMQFDGSFCLAKMNPRKYLQTQVNDCGIKCIDCLIKFNSQRLRLIELSGNHNQALSKIGVD